VTALSAPRFPGLAGYRALARASAGLGLRHIADLLAEQEVPSGAEADSAGVARFLVVDGFRLARPGNRWRRIDGAVLEQARARFVERFGAAAGAAEEIFGLLRPALDEDPGVVRQLLLYQLALLATEPRPSGADTRSLLLDLGVHSAEADVVCAMVGSYTRPRRAASFAAERVADAFAEGRIFHTGVLLEQIPPGRGDWRLERIEHEVDRRLDEARTLIEQAEGFADRYRFEQATELYVQALASAADQPRLQAGLVRAAIGIFDANADADAPGGPAGTAAPGGLRAAPVDGGIELVFAPLHHPDEDRSEWTLLRLDCSTRQMRILADDCRSGTPFIDATVQFGQEVRYVAIPYRNGLICASASACGRIRFAPEVDGAVLRCTPQGVSLDWRLPPGLVSMNVLRSCVSREVSGAPGCVQVVAGAPAVGVDDLDVAPGVYQYLVQCGYPAPPGSPDIDTVWSTGLALTAVVKPWPTPVDVLEAALIVAQPPTLRISWLPPTVGTARVVPWRFSPRRPGSDITELAAELPLGLTGDGGGESGGPYRSATVVGQPGETLRLTAVSELDDRALAGASVLIQVVQVPTGVGVQRGTDESTAVIRFDWPEPAVLVSIRWEQNGFERGLVVPRTGYRPQGLLVPVDRGECRVTVEPLGRPDAQVFGSPVSVLLPALPPPPPGALTRLGRRLRAGWRMIVSVLRHLLRLIRRIPAFVARR
jgi:hypothetical protein